jgi:hypothetical protein
VSPRLAVFLVFFFIVVSSASLKSVWRLQTIIRNKNKKKKKVIQKNETIETAARKQSGGVSV